MTRWWTVPGNLNTSSTTTTAGPSPSQPRLSYWKRWVCVCVCLTFSVLGVGWGEWGGGHTFPFGFPALSCCLQIHFSVFKFSFTPCLPPPSSLTLRGLGWCLSICSWSVTLRRRCTAPTLLSTTPACLTAATTAASSSTQNPLGLHQSEDAARQRRPVTSPYSSTRRPPPPPKAASRPAPVEAHPPGPHLQEVTKCPLSLRVTPPLTPCPGHIPPTLKARLPACPHHLFLPHTTMHTCKWAPPLVRKKKCVGESRQRLLRTETRSWQTTRKIFFITTVREGGKGGREGGRHCRVLWKYCSTAGNAKVLENAQSHREMTETFLPESLTMTPVLFIYFRLKECNNKTTCYF